MTKKEDVRYIKKCIDEISQHELSNEMLELLKFMCNIMKEDVGSRFLRGGQVHRDFSLEELRIKISYVGDLCK